MQHIMKGSIIKKLGQDSSGNVSSFLALAAQRDLSCWWDAAEPAHPVPKQHVRESQIQLELSVANRTQLKSTSPLFHRAKSFIPHFCNVWYYSKES